MTSFSAIIQEFAAPVIEELVVKPLLVRFHELATWFNFIVFTIGSFLAIWARALELKDKNLSEAAKASSHGRDSAQATLQNPNSKESD